MERKKQVFFVCIGISNNNLLDEVIAAESEEDAKSYFKNKYNIIPNKILGPFYKKRLPPVEISKNVQFTGQHKLAVYAGWRVNAFLLKDPENYAFLVFLKNLDNSPVPKGNNIVHIKDLRFI
jgi:hypothetical protein